MTIGDLNPFQPSYKFGVPAVDLLYGLLQKDYHVSESLQDPRREDRQRLEEAHVDEDDDRKFLGVTLSPS